MVGVEVGQVVTVEVGVISVAVGQRVIEGIGVSVGG